LQIRFLRDLAFASIPLCELQASKILSELRLAKRDTTAGMAGGAVDLTMTGFGAAQGLTVLTGFVTDLES
jgi:hypothetical protein